MAFALDANATIINDSRWPFGTVSRPGSTMDQYVMHVREAATDLRLLYANNQNASITIEVSICKGFRSPSNLPVRVTFGGNNAVTIAAYESAQSDILSNIDAVEKGDLLLVRTFLSAAQNIVGGVQANITFNQFGNEVPVNTFNGQRGTNNWTTVANSDSLTAADDAYESAFVVGNHQAMLLTPTALIGIPVNANPPRLGILVGDSKTTSNTAAGNNEEPQFGAFQPRIFGLYTNPERAYFSLCVPSSSYGLVNGATAQASLARQLISIPSGHNREPIFVYRYGTNSLGNTPVIATAVQAELDAISAMLSVMLPNTKCVVSTVDPVAKIVAGSGGAWATITEAQQENGGNFSVGIDMMNTYNAILRDNRPSYVTRVADCAAEVTVLPSGKWLPGATIDGIHQTAPFSILQAVPLKAAIDAVEASYRGTVRSMASSLASGLASGVARGLAG